MQAHPSTPTITLEDIRQRLQQADCRAAFLAWFETKYPLRVNQAEKFVQHPTVGLWHAFGQSAQGQAYLSKNGEPVDVQAAGDAPSPAPAPIMTRMTEALGHSDGVREPTTTAQTIDIPPPATNGHKPAT